jgi:hypothetical protein
MTAFVGSVLPNHTVGRNRVEQDLHRAEPYSAMSFQTPIPRRDYPVDALPNARIVLDRCASVSLLHLLEQSPCHQQSGVYLNSQRVSELRIAEHVSELRIDELRLGPCRRALYSCVAMYACCNGAWSSPRPANLRPDVCTRREEEYLWETAQRQICCAGSGECLVSRFVRSVSGLHEKSYLV